MIIEPFGNIEYNKRDKEWFGLVDNICPDNEVELSISVDSVDQDLKDKIELIRQLAKDYKAIVADLYDLIYKKYKETEFEVTRNELEKMYYLTSVNLKEDNKTWWLTLEPNLHVISIYAQFLRFTMHDRKIIWTNL